MLDGPITDHFKECQNLQQLNLALNYLDSTLSLVGLEKLQHSDISSNEFNSVVIANNSQLKTINAAANNISMAVVENNTSIQLFDFQQNKFEKFPDFVKPSELQSPKVVLLAHCEISEPLLAVMATSIEYLDVSRNHIRSNPNNLLSFGTIPISFDCEQMLNSKVLNFVGNHMNNSRLTIEVDAYPVKCTREINIHPQACKDTNQYLTKNLQCRNCFGPWSPLPSFGDPEDWTEILNRFFPTENVKAALSCPSCDPDSVRSRSRSVESSECKYGPSDLVLEESCSYPCRRWLDSTLRAPSEITKRLSKELKKGDFLNLLFNNSGYSGVNITVLTLTHSNSNWFWIWEEQYLTIRVERMYHVQPLFLLLSAVRLQVFTEPKISSPRTIFFFRTQSENLFFVS